MNQIATIYFVDRKEWRKWLEAHFETEEDIWLEYPREQNLAHDVLIQYICT